MPSQDTGYPASSVRFFVDPSHKKVLDLEVWVGMGDCLRSAAAQGEDQVKGCVRDDAALGHGDLVMSGLREKVSWWFTHGERGIELRQGETR